MGLKYYNDIKDTPLSDQLRKSSIKTDKQLMAFYDSSWKDCTDTSRITRAYIIFYQGGPIDYGTHVLVPVSHAGAESDYNSAFTVEMALSYFSILIHEVLNKDTDIVPEEDPLIILDSKSAFCVSKNIKDTNHIRHIDRIIHYIRNSENANCTRLTGVKEV